MATFPASVAITAGVQYWIVADTPTAGTGSDFSGIWVLVPPSKNFWSSNAGNGWNSFAAAIEEPAGAVYGTIP